MVEPIIVTKRGDGSLVVDSFPEVSEITDDAVEHAVPGVIVRRGNQFLLTFANGAATYLETARDDVRKTTRVTRYQSETWEAPPLKETPAA